MAGLHLQSVSVSSKKASELPTIVTGADMMSYVLRFLSSRLVEFSCWAEGDSKRGLILERLTFLGLQGIERENIKEVSKAGKYLLSSR